MRENLIPRNFSEVSYPQVGLLSFRMSLSIIMSDMIGSQSDTMSIRLSFTLDITETIFVSSPAIKK